MSTFRLKYPIVQRYLTGPSKRRPCIPLQSCRFMVAHDTGNPGSTAAGNVSYYERSRNDDEASAHIFVDDIQIIECIPFLALDPEKAWHVRYNPPIDNAMYGADSNDAAGGVELCFGGNIDLNESYKRFVWVLAYSCWRYGLDAATDIVGHYTLDPSRKVDPVNSLKQLGKTFTDLIADVINEYNNCLEDEDDMPMQLENDWQWKQVGDALDGLYRKGLLSDYGWAKKAYTRQLTISEAAQLNLVILARQNGVEV
ncbi:N-acetylmuramoyl-L-alanine amidase [compost metagenome]